jgi:hypothetical protein
MCQSRKRPMRHGCKVGIFTDVPRRDSKRRLASKPEQSEPSEQPVMPWRIVSDLDTTTNQSTPTQHSLSDNSSLPRTVTSIDMEPLPLERQCANENDPLTKHDSELFEALFAQQPLEPHQESYEVVVFALRFNVGSSPNSASIAANAFLSSSICR